MGLTLQGKQTERHEGERAAHLRQVSASSIHVSLRSSASTPIDDVCMNA